MSIFEALGLVLAVFGAIYLLRDKQDETEVEGDSIKYPYGLSGPADYDIQRFSGGDDEGVDDEVY